MRKTQSGKITITPVANVPTTGAVVFDEPFEGTPEIVITAQTSVPGTVCLGVGNTNPTKDGFDAVVTRTSTTPTILHWVATREESYDDKRYFDYAIAGNQWTFNSASDKVPYTDFGGGNYLNDVLVWDTWANGDVVEELVHVTNTDKATFKPLAVGTPVTVLGKSLVPVTVYDVSQIRLFDTGFADITSRFDTVGVNGITIYLTPNTGGEVADFFNRPELIKIQAIKFNYTQASGKGATPKTYYGDGISGAGYMDTFAGTKNPYGGFFIPQGG